MSLLRIDSSITGPASSSRALGDAIEAAFIAEAPEAKIVKRDIAANPVPASVWATAATAGYTPAEHQSDAQKEALALAEELFNEFNNADSILITTGLYNWGVNPLLSAYLDQVHVLGVAAGEWLKGKDVVIAVTRGGYYGEDGPKAGWDHGTPWLVRLISEGWGANVTVVERDFTLVGVNPALDQFADHAEALKLSSAAAAAEAGKVLAAAQA